MNHKIKSLIFKSLDVLPNALGYGIYHQLQKFLNRNSVTFKIKTNRKSFDEALQILQNEDISIAGKTILELGSGWAPIIPYYFLYFAKAEKVVSYDINEHYDRKTIATLNRYFSKEFQIKVSATQKKYPLPENVQYFPKIDLATDSVTIDTTVDLIFSRFVLEHIPPEALLKIHQNFAKNIPKTAYILHMISPSDHRAYTDKTLSYYEFLQYSKEEWRKKHTKFDYHNRLRLPDYIAIFEKAGFEIVSLQYDTCEKDSEKYRKFKDLQLHEDFQNYSEEELLAGSINVLLKLKD